MKSDRRFVICSRVSSLLLPLLLGPSLRAQTVDSGGPRASTKLIDQVFRLNNTTQPAEAKDLVVVLRNVLDARATINVLPDQEALVVNDTPDQLRLAQKVIDDIENGRFTSSAQPASAVFASGVQTTMHPDPYHTVEQTLYLPQTMGARDEDRIAPRYAREGTPPRRSTFSLRNTPSW